MGHENELEGVIWHFQIQGILIPDNHIFWEINEFAVAYMYD